MGCCFGREPFPAVEGEELPQQHVGQQQQLGIFGKAHDQQGNLWLISQSIELANNDNKHERIRNIQPTCTWWTCGFQGYRVSESGTLAILHKRRKARIIV